MKNIFLIVLFVTINFISHLQIQAQESIQIRRQLLHMLVVNRESAGGKYLWNPADSSAGLYGIREIMIKEANRIVGYQRFHLEDRLDSVKSSQVFDIYQNYVNPNWYVINGARLWNGGGSGLNKNGTIEYWQSIEKDIIIMGILTYLNKSKNNPFYKTKFSYLFEEGYYSAIKGASIYHQIGDKKVLVFDGKKIFY